MNSIGLCKHNNMETSCPTCIRAKTVHPQGWEWPRTLSKKGMMGYADCNCGPMSGDCGCGTMGALQCMPGFYEGNLFGLKACLPYGKTVLQTGQEAGTKLIAQGVADSPAAKELAQRQLRKGWIEKATDWSIEHKKPLTYVAVAAGILLAMGAFSGTRLILKSVGV